MCYMCERATVDGTVHLVTWENGFSVSAPHISIIFLSFFVFAQDEEQDPLLNSFSHLKEVLNNIKGMWKEKR